jgi:hypothetical protein
MAKIDKRHLGLKHLRSRHSCVTQQKCVSYHDINPAKREIASEARKISYSGVSDIWIRTINYNTSSRSPLVFRGYFYYKVFKNGYEAGGKKRYER